MNKNSGYNAFTLAEILVGITIITMLSLGVSRIDFNRLSQNQNAEIESTKILNIIQEARNNALIGRGVGVNLDTPDAWSVRISSAGSGSVESSWNVGATTGSGSSWNTKFPFEITNLRCQTLAGGDDLLSDPNITLSFSGSQADISGCSGNNYKKVVFDFGSPGNTREISINAVTGIIERN